MTKYFLFFIACYATDILLIIPSKLLLQFLLTDIITYRSAQRLREGIVVRSKRILNRHVGHFWAAGPLHAFIQHRNPACRAARMLTPGLSVSLLLMQIRDADFPVLLRRYKPSSLFYYGALLEKIVELCLFLLWFIENYFKLINVL